MILGHLSRFLQVGALAFVVDAIVLWALIYQLDMPPIMSRVISFMATIIVTFVLNARYTFVVSMRHSSKVRYVMIQCLGAAINFLLYSWFVLADVLGPLWSLVVGSGVSSAHNFFMMRHFVFHGAIDKPPA